MKTIYFGIYHDKEDDEITLCTSYTNDGYMSDLYSEEDYKRLDALEVHGIYRAMESSFEVPEGKSAEEIISLMNTIPGFVYESKLGNI